MSINKIVLVFMALLSVASHAQEVTKDQWITGMKANLPTVFCKSNQYFRRCFDVTTIECEDVAASATRICLKEMKNQIPAILIQPKGGTLWGKKVGACAGAAYQAAFIKRRISNATCNNTGNQ